MSGPHPRVATSSAQTDGWSTWLLSPGGVKAAKSPSPLRHPDTWRGGFQWGPILGHRCPCWFTRCTEVLPLCHLGLGRGSGKGLSVYPGPPLCCPGITPIINAVDIVLIFSTFQMGKQRRREGNAPHTAWSTCGHKLYPLHKPAGALTRAPVHIRPLSPQHRANVGMKINRGWRRQQHPQSGSGLFLSVAPQGPTFLASALLQPRTREGRALP